MPDFCNIVAEKRAEKISLLVFHCFALNTIEMLSVFEKTNTGVHYIIMRNGTILNLIDENAVAKHAGISSWRQIKENVNAKSIGIELQNSLMGNKDYTKAQIRSLIKLSKDIIKRHKIEPQNVVGHSDIAPCRKPDPGKFFPWAELAKNGVGIWKKIQNLPEKNCVLDKEKILELLQTIGYDTTDLTAAIYAFVTRFMPQKINARKDIIQTEAEVFAYWRGKNAADTQKELRKAPKIYPSDAEKFLKDCEVSARLIQIAAAYQEKK